MCLDSSPSGSRSSGQSCACRWVCIHRDGLRWRGPADPWSTHRTPHHQQRSPRSWWRGDLGGKSEFDMVGNIATWVNLEDWCLFDHVILFFRVAQCSNQFNVQKLLTALNRRPARHLALIPKVGFKICVWGINETLSVCLFCIPVLLTRVVNTSLDDVIHGEATGGGLAPQLSIDLLGQHLQQMTTTAGWWCSSFTTSCVF